MHGTENNLSKKKSKKKTKERNPESSGDRTSSKNLTKECEQPDKDENARVKKNGSKIEKDEEHTDNHEKKKKRKETVAAAKEGDGEDAKVKKDLPEDEEDKALVDTKYQGSKKKSSRKRLAENGTVKEKRVKNTYFWFAGEHRQSVKEELGTNDIKEVSKVLGARWNAMDKESRAPYVKMYEDEKVARENAKNVF